MSITSMNARMGMAEKLDIPQLTRAVQDGTIPSFIGIPLIQEKLRAQQGAATMRPSAPPVAEQVMQQAEMAQGIPGLPSRMPQEYAQGGILHYAEGDLVDDDDYDEMLYDEQMSEAQKQIEKLRNQMMEDQAARSYGGIDYAEAPNPQVEYHTTPTKEEAKVSKGTPSDFESLAVSRGKKHGVDESLVRHVMHKETGGLKDRAGAVSPAGAIGVMQLMPATAKGLGVQNPYDPEQNIEGGVKYLGQLMRKYQDPKLAAIAYNWGPGNTDKWLAAGADISRLPRETRGYIQNMAEGGITKLAAGDLIIPPTDDLEKQKDMLRRLRNIERAKAGFSTMPEVATVTPTPAATSNLTYGQRLMNFLSPSGGAAMPLAVTGGVGALLSKGSANALSNATPEQREQLMGDIGSDTSMAAAIMNEAKPSAPTTPARPATGAGAGRGTQGAPTAAQAAQNVNINKPFGDIDLEATDRSLGAVQPTAPEPSKAEEAPVDSSMSGVNEIKNLLKARGEGLAKQKDIDNYMALLSAGLGIMGGRSPFAAENIGQGSQQGINYALQAGKTRAAEENALMSGHLGLYKYQQSAEANKINRDYLKIHREEQNELKRMGLSNERAKVLADQDIKMKSEQDRVLGQMEGAAKNMAIAKLKTAFTEQEKAKVEADAMAGLYSNPRYREIYKARNGFYPDLGTTTAGKKTVPWAG